MLVIVTLHNLDQSDIWMTVLKIEYEITKHFRPTVFLLVLHRFNL